MNEKDAPILVVDDESDMCWILEKIICKEGFISMKALSGMEAIAMTENNIFGLAFLDAKLTDIDGLELARQLRNADASLPIVIVSGYYYQDDQYIKAALQSGLITAFVGKPFDHDDIVKVIANYKLRQAG